VVGEDLSIRLARGDRFQVESLDHRIQNRGQSDSLDVLGLSWACSGSTRGQRFVSLSAT
jgi:hypothetical protein